MYASGLCSTCIDLLWFGIWDGIFLQHHSDMLLSNITPWLMALKPGLLETGGCVWNRNDDQRIFLKQTLFFRQCFDLHRSHCGIFTLKYMSNFFLLLQTPSLLQGQVQVSLGMQQPFLGHGDFSCLDYTHWCLVIFSKVYLFKLGFA